MSTIKKKILIIDDEAVFRDAMTRALTKCKYQCISETNPADGIMRLKKEPFDLVLLDIMMDPFDGWDTLSHIRSLSNGSDIPVIMASAKQLDIHEVYRFGEYLAGFQVKPFDDTEFCEEIRKFFSWYDPLLANAHAALLQGVPKDVCNRWIRLYRQIIAINQMLEVVNPRCISDGTASEEECMQQTLTLIREMVAEKVKERDEIRILHPVFTL